jgi:cytochrome c oxidase subunit 3
VNAPAASMPNAEQERDSARLGIWIFIAAELMFFGPLFLAYAFGRFHYAAAFASASRHTDIVLGTINTVILLTSSFFMALAVRSVQLGNAPATRRWLWAVAALGSTFLIFKGIEYHEEYREQLIPWLNFSFDALLRIGAGYFYYLYFGMTGLHAIHLTIGIGLMTVLALRLRHRRAESMSTMVEMSGLYWHFVDAVWVFLYPMIYLVERHP